MISEENKYFISDEIQSQARKKVVQVKLKLIDRGNFDVFDIISRKAILIKKPLKSAESRPISGFTTYMDGHFIVFINTFFSLGHQIFTAAHELYHLEFDAQYLIDKKLIFGAEKSDDIHAQAFASEFLMPEDAVKEYYYKHLKDVMLSPIHIIRMHHEFKVSYRAMLVKLLQLGLIMESDFNELEKMGFLDMKEEFQALTKSQGYDTALIQSTNDASFPTEYLHYVLENYKRKKISYGRLCTFLDFINKEPKDFGIHLTDEKDNI